MVLNPAPNVDSFAFLDAIFSFQLFGKGFSSIARIFLQAVRLYQRNLLC